MQDEQRVDAEPAGEEEIRPAFRVTDRRWWAREDEGDEAPSEERKPTYIENLEAELAAARAEAARAQERQRRALAELEEAQARLQRESKRELDRARRALVLPFLEVLDDLDRALEAASGEGTVEALRDGVGLVQRGFLTRLRAQGVTRIEALGQPFDPRWHEALGRVPVASREEDGRVVAVVKAGYAFGDEPLRIAQVMVGHFSETPEPPSS